MQRVLAGAALWLAGCNFEVPSSAYLSETKLITVLVEVVELGPLNPERVAVPQAQPIAEAMPGDRVALEAYVVDSNGERLASGELDSLWFQCGPFECGETALAADSELFDVDCDELEGEGLPWTMDAVCRLGTGDGRFEFTAPELGQLMVEIRVAQYYGVIAWAGRSAEDCWATRRSGVGDLEHCGFIQRSVRIGPSWWMLAYAETIGLQSPIPLPKIPIGVYIQQANRAPDPVVEVWIDGEPRGTWPDEPRFAVEPGSRVELRASYDPTAQFLQSYFVVNLETFLFTATPELIRDRPFTSNAMVWIEPEVPFIELTFPQTWRFAVDEYADPGVSRVLIHYFDDRFGEGVATLEFEVGG